MKPPLLVIVILTAACQAPSRSELMDIPTETVVVVHGLARTHRSMAMLSAHLRDEGYAVVAWDYPSLTGTVEEHGATLRERLEELTGDPQVKAVHLVTHSMGGLVTRAALLPSSPVKVQRVVMLAPPNQGSPVARWVAPVLGQWVTSLQDLSDAPESAAQRLPPPKDVEIGVIAAAFDHAVSEESTHMEGEADHLEMPGMHSFLMWQPPVLDQVVAFLRNGRFQRD